MDTAPWQVLDRRTIYSSPAPDVRRLILHNEVSDGLTLTALSWALVAGVIA